MNRITTTLPAVPAQPAAPARPKVAVVLGSGGMKAFAALPLFEVLNEAGVTIDLLVGCSGGAIISAAIAGGYSPTDIRQMAPDLVDHRIFGKLDYSSIASIVSSRFGRFDLTCSLIRPERMREIYRGLWSDKQIQDLSPRLLVQTTDMLTGEGVTLSRGSVADAVYASGAFFPILPPLMIENRWLADGAYSAPVPVLEAVKRNMDVIIALDFAERSTAAPEGFLDCFQRYLDSSMTTLKRSQMLLSLQMHHHEIVVIEVNFDKPVSFRDVQAMPTILAKGEEIIAEYKDTILQAIANFAEIKKESR